MVQCCEQCNATDDAKIGNEITTVMRVWWCVCGTYDSRCFILLVLAVSKCVWVFGIEIFFEWNFTKIGWSFIKKWYRIALGFLWQNNEFLLQWSWICILKMKRHVFMIMSEYSEFSGIKKTNLISSEVIYE